MEITNRKVRVRFAPSPTGGLHIGGVRTALFNYLFAKKHGGDFILRIEDTDQTRFVKGAEEYIIETLKWCGIEPNEGVGYGGSFGPYRQSERKSSYRQYAEQLVAAGHAYYAFDTPAEIEMMRERLKAGGNPAPQYNWAIREYMKNSLTLPAEEVAAKLAANEPHVIRIKVPRKDEIKFHDLIRGWVSFQTNQIDDKVLLKADGMPTYHLAVVVDDHTMQITHAFRGEEWLPSAPVHVLLYKYLGWESTMPNWAHLPLILKPDGNGKLSKRDGDRLGFPVFSLDWTTADGTLQTGFREKGFIPEALINFLALLGWSPGSTQEIFTKEELISLFDIERINKAGAKFDYEKAKWFNHQYVQQLDNNELGTITMSVLDSKGITANKDYVSHICGLVKERCTFVTDVWENAFFFFEKPIKYDLDAVLPKWNDQKNDFFVTLIDSYKNIENWQLTDIENTFKNLATSKNIKLGELQMPFRIMLCGGKFGPPVFEIAHTLKQTETVERLTSALIAFSNK
jgi:glutamyl-tRNA synthetase